MMASPRRAAPRKLTTERQRQELLFDNYVKLTESE